MEKEKDFQCPNEDCKMEKERYFDRYREYSDLYYKEWNKNEELTEQKKELTSWKKWLSVTSIALASFLCASLISISVFTFDIKDNIIN